MLKTKPIYVSPRGAAIICFRGDAGRVFRTCLSSKFIYSRDLHSAKSYLDILEKANMN